MPRRARRVCDRVRERSVKALQPMIPTLARSIELITVARWLEPTTARSVCTCKGNPEPLVPRVGIEELDVFPGQADTDLHTAMLLPVGHG
jgi:hypothetical protein